MSSANSLKTHILMMFDGTDWQVFSSLFKAYSMMSGFWGHLNSDEEELMQPQPITIGKGDSAVTTPVSPEDMKEYSKELREWKKYEERALGCLTLSVSLTVGEYIKDKSAKDAWAALKEKYGTASAVTVFGYFKKLITFKLSGDNPLPEFACFDYMVERLELNDLPLPAFIKAMLLIVAIPQKWDHAVSHCLQNWDTNDLDVSIIQDAIQTEYETMSGAKVQGPPVWTAAAYSQFWQLWWELWWRLWQELQ
ncbi:hypothetical protein L218DRAFT_1026462 [Marasmius fiardii PR-910]|nr:hypothetical protein L218DRAFT_1026462 [Marasmius fiardii PR-910]